LTDLIPFLSTHYFLWSSLTVFSLIEIILSVQVMSNKEGQYEIKKLEKETFFLAKYFITYNIRVFF
jgi:hypothetical protein